MALYDFPKPSNALLTPAEKCVIDMLPEDAKQEFLNAKGEQTGQITAMNVSGVATITLETPERVQAVKDYIEMIDELKQAE